jgi:hypothetical protein
LCVMLWGIPYLKLIPPHCPHSTHNRHNTSDIIIMKALYYRNTVSITNIYSTKTTLNKLLSSTQNMLYLHTQK